MNFIFYYCIITTLFISKFSEQKLQSALILGKVRTSIEYKYNYYFH